MVEVIFLFRVFFSRGGGWYLFSRDMRFFLFLVGFWGDIVLVFFVFWGVFRWVVYFRRF